VPVSTLWVNCMRTAPTVSAKPATVRTLRNRTLGCRLGAGGVAVVLLAGLSLTVMPSPALAASGETSLCTSGGYGCLSDTGYSGQSVWGSWGPGHNCVSYAAYRLRANGAVQPWAPIGNGNQWDEKARAAGVRVDTTPAAGSIAQWDSGSAGHVAYVDIVTPTHIEISEDSYLTDTSGYTSRRRLDRNGTTFGSAEFIHVRDVGGASANRDISGDGRADLALIGTGPTGSGRLEVHALNGATAYSSWLGNWATAAGYGNSADRYVMGDVNGDGRADLTIVATGPTGSGRLEAHVLDGATGFSSWLGNWATAAGYGNSSTEYVMGDVNGDGRAELVFVATGPTGSGRLEVHALNGATAYSSWLGNWATAAGYGNSTNRYVM
jgi:surface antigen